MLWCIILFCDVYVPGAGLSDLLPFWGGCDVYVWKRLLVLLVLVFFEGHWRHIQHAIRLSSGDGRRYWAAKIDSSIIYSRVHISHLFQTSTIILIDGILC